MFRAFQKGVFHQVLAAKCVPGAGNAAPLCWRALDIMQGLRGRGTKSDCDPLRMQSSSHLDSSRAIKSNTHKMPSVCSSDRNI